MKSGSSNTQFEYALSEDSPRSFFVPYQNLDCQGGISLDRAQDLPESGEAVENARVRVGFSRPRVSNSPLPLCRETEEG